MVAKCSVNFEEALSMAGFGKFHVLSLLVTLTLLMGMTFEIVSVAYLVPESACELHTTSSQQGLMAGMPILGIIATSYFMGYLADTRGRRTVLGWTMVLAFLTGALAALSPNWIVFSFFKFLSSGALAGTLALALTLLSECTPQNRRSVMVALTTTIYLIAMGAMAVLAIPVLHLKFSYHIPYLDIHFNSWRLLNLVYASSCAVGAVSVYCSYESPRYFLSVGEEEKALEVLRGMYVINTGNSANEYKVSSLVLGEETGEPVKGMLASLMAQTVPLLKPPLLKNTVLLSVLYITVYTGVNPFVVWLPYIADAIMKANERGETNLTLCQMLDSSQKIMTENTDCSLNTFAMVTVFTISTTIAILNVVLSFFVNHIGRKRMVIGVQVVAGVAALCINASCSPVLSIICMILFIAGTVNYGFITTFSVDLFPTYVKAMGVCITLMIGRGCSFLGVNIVKTMLIDDCELAFYIFGGLTFVGGVLAFLLPAEGKRAETQSARN